MATAASALVTALVAILIVRRHASARAALGLGYGVRGHSVGDYVTVFPAKFVSVRGDNIRPHMRGHIVLRNTAAFAIHNAGVELRVAVTMLGGGAKPRTAST